MQRKILICRHADSEDPYPLQPDFERKLTAYGVQQARETGMWVRENFGKVDKIIASPANRTSHTARIIAGRLYFNEERIDYRPELYNAREQEILKELADLSDKDNSVLLVGHNPGVTKLVRELTDKMVGYLETAQVIALEINLESWDQLYFTTATLSGINNQKV